MCTINTPSESAGSSRSYTKCSRCRHDRKICSPQSRDWTWKQKCDRCIRLGHPCGPPERAPRKDRSEREEDDLTSATSETMSGVYSPMTDASDVSLQPHGEWTTVRQRTEFAGRASYELAANSTAQKLFTRCRSDLENYLKSDVEMPQDPQCIGTRFCRDIYRFIITRLDHLHTHQLYEIDESQLHRNTFAINLPSDISKSLDPVTGDFKTLMCSRYVLKSFRPYPTSKPNHFRSRTHRLPSDYYRSTEATLKALMATISHHDHTRDRSPVWRQGYKSLVGSSGPFPASHIAYWNLDRSASFELWKYFSRHEACVDVLGRTFPHVVAEAGDLEMLSKIDIWDLKAIHTDARGLSLLDLAVISGNAAVVGWLLNRNIVQPPYIRAMQRAICTGRPEIALEHVLQHMTPKSWSDLSEIETLADLAGARGYEHLQIRLRAITCAKVASQTVIDELENANQQQMSNVIARSEHDPPDGIM